MEEYKDITALNYIPANADYESAELNQLRTALRRSYTERFLMMTRLMKMNEMFKKAKITRTTYSLDK